MKYTTCYNWERWRRRTQAGLKKTRFKAQPTAFLGFYWVLGFIGFFRFFFEPAVEKLVGWFSSSAKLLFIFTSTFDYLKICKFITYWSLEAVNIKKFLIITGTTNWNWIKFGAGVCCFFNGFYPKNLTRFFGALPRCLNLEPRGIIRLTQVYRENGKWMQHAVIPDRHVHPSVSDCRSTMSTVVFTPWPENSTLSAVMIWIT